MDSQALWPTFSCSKTVRRAVVTNAPRAVVWASGGPHGNLIPRIWIPILPFVPSIPMQIVSSPNAQNHKGWTWQSGWPCILSSKLGHFRNTRGWGTSRPCNRKGDSSRRTRPYGHSNNNHTQPVPQKVITNINDVTRRVKGWLMVSMTNMQLSPAFHCHTVKCHRGISVFCCLSCPFIASRKEIQGGNVFMWWQNQSLPHGYHSTCVWFVGKPRRERANVCSQESALGVQGSPAVSTPLSP